MSGVADVAGRWAPGSWPGGIVTARATCVLAPNPTPWTLEGTNTWVLAEPGSSRCVVVDPGPLDEGHLARTVSTATEAGRHIALILLTHGHDDHAAGADRLAALTGAPIRAIGRGHDDLADGDVVSVGGLDLDVVTTPGHTTDSVSFRVVADNALLTGDTILGWGTSVIAWPDGRLSAYLESLRRLSDLAGSANGLALWPGHGGVIDDAPGKVAYYLDHRHERLRQVREALDAGCPWDADSVVEVVYADVPRVIWPAARLSVLAQLEYLQEVSG